MTDYRRSMTCLALNLTNPNDDRAEQAKRYCYRMIYEHNE